MCRHLAYLGPPVTLDALLVAPPHSLVDQAQAARCQQSGTRNPDGSGVGWYPATAAGTVATRPERHRDSRPIWEDDVFAALAPLTRTTAALAAVRLASPGAPIDVTGNAPFLSGPWLFSHNGVVEGHFDGAGNELRSRVTPRRVAEIGGAADSEVLFALTLDALDVGESPGEALAATIATVATVTTGRLNLLLTDGTRIAATAWENSLFTFADSTAGRVVVASEPFDDDPRWVRVPDRSLVEATRTHVTCTPL